VRKKVSRKKISDYGEIPVTAHVKAHPRRGSWIRKWDYDPTLLIVTSFMDPFYQSRTTAACAPDR
jgi:hypothetical protein